MTLDERPDPLYRVCVTGGGSFLYDLIDVGRFARRMATEGDRRPFTVALSSSTEGRSEGLHERRPADDTADPGVPQSVADLVALADKGMAVCKALGRDPSEAPAYLVHVSLEGPTKEDVRRAESVARERGWLSEHPGS